MLFHNSTNEVQAILLELRALNSKTWKLAPQLRWSCKIHSAQSLEHVQVPWISQTSDFRDVCHHLSNKQNQSSTRANTLKWKQFSPPPPEEIGTSGKSKSMAKVHRTCESVLSRLGSEGYEPLQNAGATQWPVPDRIKEMSLHSH